MDKGYDAGSVGFVVSVSSGVSIKGEGQGARILRARLRVFGLRTRLRVRARDV